MTKPRPSLVLPTLLALGLLGGVAGSYLGMAPDLVRGSAEWHTIALVTFAGLAVLALPLTIVTALRHQWLPAVLAALVVLHVPGFLVLQRTLFTPEHRFDLSRARWEAAPGHVHDRDLAEALLAAPETRALLARPDVRSFLVGRLEMAPYWTVFAAEKLRLPALLAWEGFRQRPDQRPRSLLGDPAGHRVLRGLIVQELRPLTHVEAPEWPALLRDLTLRPSDGLRFGLLDTDDVRAFSAQALARVDSLPVAEVELLALAHTRVPVRLDDADFDRLIDRLAALKPHHAAYLGDLRAFRHALCRAVGPGPDGRTVAVRIRAPLATGGLRPQTAPGERDSIVPLLHTCGVLWQPGAEDTPVVLDVQEDLTELYSHKLSKPVYKTERSQWYSSRTRSSTTLTRQVYSHSVNQGSDTHYRSDFTQTLRLDGTEVAKLQGIRRLDDRWYDVEAGRMAPDAPAGLRHDSWLLTVPEEFTYPWPER